MYIPVAEATEGGTPWLRRRGLKIAPPLSPKHPEAQPPTKAVITTDLTVFLLNLMSLGMSPLPTLVFKACSAIIFLIEKTLAPKQMKKYRAKRIQSKGPQCSIPTTEGLDLLPLKKLIRIWEPRTTKQIACLSHWPCPFSFSRILSTYAISSSVGPTGPWFFKSPPFNSSSSSSTWIDIFLWLDTADCLIDFLSLPDSETFTDNLTAGF